jgi:hypothetical protein
MINIIELEVDFNSEQSLDDCIKRVSYSVMLSRRPESFINDMCNNPGELIKMQNELTDLGDFAVIFIKSLMGAIRFGNLTFIKQEGNEVMRKIMVSIEELNRRINILHEFQTHSMKKAANPMGFPHEA